MRRLVQGSAAKKRNVGMGGLDGGNLEELGLQDRLMCGGSLFFKSHTCERREQAFSGGSPVVATIGRDGLSRATKRTTGLAYRQGNWGAPARPRKERYLGGNWRETLHPQSGSCTTPQDSRDGINWQRIATWKVTNRVMNDKNTA